jgi:uncharacterized protein YgbK (DUF1537 family)
MTLEEMTNQEIAKFLRVISSNALSTTFTYVSIATIADRLDALSTQQPAQTTTPVVEATQEAQAYIEAKEDPAPEQTEVAQTQTINRQELKDLCMSLVRANPDMKPIIKNIISRYGATTIDKVVEVDLHSLKYQLESL